MLTYKKIIFTNNTDFTLFIRENGSAASLAGLETKTLALLNKHKAAITKMNICILYIPHDQES
jgi:hypothetical protein